MRTYENWGERELMSVQTFVYNFLKDLIRTLKRKKECSNGQELLLKVKKDQEQYERAIIDLKGELQSFIILV